MVKPEESPTLSSLLVSSPEDADPSNEGFLTPSEDVAPPEAASVSAELPVSVPLPGSFPVATSVLPEDTNKTSTEPEPEAPRPESSKPAEPVIAPEESSNSGYVQPRPRPPPAASTVRPVSPPSRTASPAAPPLPRRAAARRAVPPPPPAAPPAPASPPPAADVRPKEIAEQPNGHHVEQTESHAAEPDPKANIPNPVVAPESDPSPSSEEPGNSPPPKEKDEEEKEGQADVLPVAEAVGSPVSETSTVEAEFVDVAAEAVVPNGDQPDEKQQQPQPQPKRPLSADSSTPHGDTTIETSAEGADTTTTTNDVDAEPPERPRGLEKMKMPAPAPEEEEAATAGHPPLPPPRHPRPPPVRSTERRALSESTTSSVGNMGVGKSDKPAEPEFALDGTPYVGDGTWEERTWKELTRLREDMFWARVGSAQ